MPIINPKKVILKSKELSDELTLVQLKIMEYEKQYFITTSENEGMNVLTKMHEMNNKIQNFLSNV